MALIPGMGLIDGSSTDVLTELILSEVDEIVELIPCFNGNCFSLSFIKYFAIGIQR